MHDFFFLSLSPSSFSFSFVLSPVYIQLLARQTVGRGIFIGCKGRHFTIHKSVYSARAVLPRFLHPGYIHYPFRGLSKGGHWHALSPLWDLQVTLPVTPRKLGLTTLTGPNCFLPAIRPWPTSRVDVLEKFQRDHCPWNRYPFISHSIFNIYDIPILLYFYHSRFNNRFYVNMFCKYLSNRILYLFIYFFFHFRYKENDASII